MTNVRGKKLNTLLPNEHKTISQGHFLSLVPSLKLSTYRERIADTLSTKLLHWHERNWLKDKDLRRGVE